MKTDTVFLTPSPYTTLTEPSYVRTALTVSTYDDRNGSFSSSSGRGYSRIDSIKPNISAPGVMVSTISGKQSGSSLGAGITAGAVADFMQWAVLQGNDTLINNNSIKSYFSRGALRDNGLTYPNKEFGFGALCLKNSMPV